MPVPIYVAFTMDCERIASESPPGGPATWEQSQRSIQGYCARLLDHGYPPTLFLTPECAAEHSAMLGRLVARGAELGLHVHPQSLGDHRYGRYLGEYDGEMQHQILGQAAEAMEHAVGIRPRSFRPGNFSASDATFGVLYELGFRQGSVSDPGRDAPQFAAVWVGAPAEPHYVDPEDKLRPGSLPFLEVPLTTDPERRHPNGFPFELRIESGPFEAWHRQIMEKALRKSERAERDATAPKALCIFTHNYHAFDDPRDPHTMTLQAMLDYLSGLSSKESILPVTLRTMHHHVQGAHLHDPGGQD
jgi:hypothetical protein